MTFSDVDRFVNRLQKVNIENVFNPYHDTDHVSDLQDAASIRSENISQYLLKCQQMKLSIVWFGDPF